MAFASTYSVAIQDSTAITPERIAPYIYTFREVTPYLQIVTGFEDFFKMVARKKLQAPEIYARSKQAATTLDQMNILGVPMPDKIKTLKKKQAKVITAGSIPETYTFASVDYTSSSTSYEFASPARLIPKNSLIEVKGDSATWVIKADSVTPTTGGGAAIGFTTVSGTAGTLTNTSTAKTVKLLGALAAENGAVQAQENQTASVSTFGMTKIQTSIATSTESLVTLYDTEDPMVVAGDALLPKLDSIGKQLNNMLLFAPSVSATTDTDGNAMSVAPGLVNFSGIGSTSGASAGVGPTNFEAMIDAIMKVSCLDCPVPMEGGQPVLDVFCGRSIKILIDKMLHTAAAPFGTTGYTESGDTEYDFHTNTWNGLTAKLKIHYDRSFDTGAYTGTLAMLNRNAIVPIWLDKHFMRMEQVSSQTDANKYSIACTNIFGQVLLVPAHVQLLTSITAIES